MSYRAQGSSTPRLYLVCTSAQDVQHTVLFPGGIVVNVGGAGVAAVHGVAVFYLSGPVLLLLLLGLLLLTLSLLLLMVPMVRVGKGGLERSCRFVGGSLDLCWCLFLLGAIFSLYEFFFLFCSFSLRVGDFFFLLVILFGCRNCLDSPTLPPVAVAGVWLFFSPSW